MSYSFDARVVNAARKAHTCMACLRPIPAGMTYIAYPGQNSNGKFKTTHLCVECSYLLTRKDGANAHTIREGEFSDALIPNCLRKLRTAFRKNPKQAIRDAGLDKAPDRKPDTKTVKHLIVSKKEYDSITFRIAESRRHPASGFIAGETLEIRAGVSGARRSVKIISAAAENGIITVCTADPDAYEISDTQYRKLRNWPFLLLTKAEAARLKPEAGKYITLVSGGRYGRRYIYAVQTLKKEHAIKYGAKSDMVVLFLPENEE